MNRALLRLALTLALLLAPALAEEVKALLDVPAPYATDVRWFPDGRHLLLASCSGEFPEDVPYPNCRFVVFDTKTQEATPVKLANGRGNWQAPGLVHVALADDRPNCVWAVSTSGKLYSRALPKGMAASGGFMDPKGSRLLVDDSRSDKGPFLFVYDALADRYISAGEYDLALDPLGLYYRKKLDIPTAWGRGYLPYLVPYTTATAQNSCCAFQALSTFVPFEDYEPGHYVGPIYDEAALVELPSKRVLYRVAGDRVLVSYDWSPASGPLEVALIIAPKDIKKARDPRYRRLLVLAAASQTPSQTKKGNKISFDQSDRTPKSCSYPNDQARPGIEPSDSDWRTGPIDFAKAQKVAAYYCYNNKEAP